MYIGKKRPNLVWFQDDRFIEVGTCWSVSPYNTIIYTSIQLNFMCWRIEITFEDVYRWESIHGVSSKIHYVIIINNITYKVPPSGCQLATLKYVCLRKKNRRRSVGYALRTRTHTFVVYPSLKQQPSNRVDIQIRYKRQ